MNFDTKINRKNTNSIKWDGHTRFNVNPSALPLWVADMDFKTLPEITQALNKQVEFGIYGYAFEPESYFEAIVHWMKLRHHWEVQKEWILTTPGVVSGLNACILAFTHENDSILIQEPVYHPFKNSINYNKRIPIINELVRNDTHYTINFEDFEKKIIEHDVKLFILCSPHNPVGRVWLKEELIQMADICHKHNVIIVSDEIHMDFVFKGFEHHVLVNLKPEYKDFVITLVAPSKSFNLAAFKVSQLITPNKEYLEKVKHEYERLGFHGHNTFGLLACEVAYRQGDQFMDEVVEYIDKNIHYIKEYISNNLSQIKVMDIEGTYLLWLDFSALNLEQKALIEFLEKNAKLWFNDGSIFGASGKGFVRMNCATQKEIIIQALDQLNNALNDKVR
jgi:cysteine-S-conjugate beta-lyase